MIRKFVKRCLVALVLCVTILFLAVGCCLALVSSSPSFYAAADSIPEADAKTALEEIDLTVGAVQLFLMVGPENLQLIEAMPADELSRGMSRITEERLPATLDLLNRSTDVAEGTFVASFTERQINAWLSQEMDPRSKELQRPRLAFESDLIRFGVTVVTPLAEAVVSFDCKPIASDGSDLTLELHAVRLGRMPIPASRLLELYMQANPRLPKGVQLNLDGDYPKVTLKAKQGRAALRVDDLEVAEGELRLKLRRKNEAVVAAK